MLRPKNIGVLITPTLIVALAAQVYGQSLSNEAAAPGLPPQAGVHRWIDGVTVPASKGNPFSAKVEIEATQQLQDGTTITSETFNIVGRDASGRTHNEARSSIKGTAEPKISFISIYDPGTRTRTVLYPAEHLARVSEVKGTHPSASQEDRLPGGKTEDLGDQTIEGFQARGMRTITTYPAGAVGNDKPFDVVTETWYSKDLEMTLLIRRNDPRYGSQTVRVTEINQTPDSALFEVPADYKIVNETKP